MSTSSSTNKRGMRGAAMVEMAILVVLLVILFIGITEIGRAVFFQQKLAKATESAARQMGRSWQAVNLADCSHGPQWETATGFAAHLAVFGDSANAGTAAIPGFDVTDIDFEALPRDAGDAGSVCVVQVRTTVAYEGIFGTDLVPLLGISQPTLHAESEERYVGD